MIEPTRTVVVANPHSRGGWVGLNWKSLTRQIQDVLGDGVEFVQTECPGDGTRRAREAAEAGASTIVSFGGDGTHSEVCEGLMQSGRSTEVSLGVLHAGTGGDFRKLLRDSDDLTRACKVIATEPAEPVDCGLVRYRDYDGGMAERHFLNIASLGLGGLVDRFVNESKHRLRGGAAYTVATLRANAAYKPAKVRLAVDGVEVGEFRISNICVCNGRWAGGGMQFAPDARVADGLFDIIVLKAASTLRSVPVLLGLYRGGTHIDSSLVVHLRGKTVTVTTMQHDAHMDIDGEAPGTASPAEFEIRPHALRIHGVFPEML